MQIIDCTLFWIKWIYLYKFAKWCVVAADAGFPILAIPLSSKPFKIICCKPASLRNDTLLSYRKKIKTHLLYTTTLIQLTSVFHSNHVCKETCMLFLHFVICYMYSCVVARYLVIHLYSARVMCPIIYLGFFRTLYTSYHIICMQIVLVYLKGGI